jgi:hypothetical protein
MRIFFSAVTALVITCGLLIVPGAMAEDSQQTSFRGCLAGTNDNYVLRDEATGKLYRLHSDKDIQEHVGDMVEVKGTIDDKKRENEAKVQDNAAQQAGIEIPTSGINVEDLKTVSKGCGEAKANQPTAAHQPAPADQATPAQPAQSEQPVQPQQ